MVLYKAWRTIISDSEFSYRDS